MKKWTVWVTEGKQERVEYLVKAETPEEAEAEFNQNYSECGEEISREDLGWIADVEYVEEVDEKENKEK